MKSGKTFLCIFLTAIYFFFPGNALAFVNHIFHDKGLPEIDCLCCSETEQHAEHPLNDRGDDAGTQNLDCTCSSHIPLNRTPLEHNQTVTSIPLCEPLFSFPEMYYPIFVPPQNLTA